MIRSFRLLAAAGFGAIAFMPMAFDSVRAETRDELEMVLREYVNSRPDLVEQLIREAIAKNPQILRNAIAEMLKSRVPSQGQQAAAPRPSTPPDRTQDIKNNAEALLHSPRQVVLGNPDGDVTMVEFFDYNCGYCKRASGDLEALLASDGKLRVVLKELPVLGPGSLEAAQVGAALRMQDPSGKRYYDFHKKLMAERRADKAVALAAAKEAGADMARLERDLQSPEIAATLEESSRLARTLGINGTPSYVIGSKVIPGARGAEALRASIREARS